MQNTVAGSVCYSNTEPVFTHSIIYMERKNMKLHNVQMWKGKNVELTDYKTRPSQVPNSKTGVKTGAAFHSCPGSYPF